MNYDEKTQVTDQKDSTIRFKSRFIDDMAFQIRTLSNAIIGFSELLLYENLNQVQSEYVNDICHAGKTVASLINDVQEFSRIASGQFEVDTVNCPLADLLDKLDSSIRANTDEKGLEFKISQKTALPANIRSDSVRLCQCLVNLANNVIEFTETGCIHLDISLEDYNSKPFIRFDISNSGQIIPGDNRKDIFEPFAQSNGRVFARTGLELPIAGHIAALLGGKVTLTTGQGQGSAFSLITPANVDIKSELLLEPHHDLSSKPQDGTDPDHVKFAGHVLLVEDEPSNRIVMSLLLETMGIYVSIAEDGLQAIQKASDEHFDLILMDIKMPGMDGCEAAKIIRQKNILTPIIALSADSAGDNKEMQTYFNCFLSKPVESKKLYETIKAYLPVVNGQNMPMNCTFC